MNYEYFGGSDVTNVLIDSFLESEKQKTKCFNESFSK